MPRDEVVDFPERCIYVRLPYGPKYSVIDGRIELSIPLATGRIFPTPELPLVE